MNLRIRPLLLAAFTATSALSAFAQNKQPAIPWDAMDLGPFHSATFKIPQRDNHVVAKGIAIKVGSKDSPATVLFDTELLRVSAGWTGGFIEIPRGRGGLEGQTIPSGELAFGTGYAPGWVVGPMVDDPRDLHQGHLPNKEAKYRGLFLNGAEVVLNYSVGQAIVMELRKQKPDMKILVLGIFPRSAKPTDAIRDKIKTANATIAKLDDGKQVFYKDIGEKFLEKDGTLEKKVMPDLLHLSPEGYDIWAAAIKDDLAKLLK